MLRMSTTVGSYYVHFGFLGFCQLSIPAVGASLLLNLTNHVNVLFCSVHVLVYLGVRGFEQMRFCQYESCFDSYCSWLNDESWWTRSLQIFHMNMFQNHM